MSEEVELIQSPLNGLFTNQGDTVDVRIYRLATEDWSLEIVDERGNSVVWSDLFPTDDEAYAAFVEDVETEGLKAMISEEPIE